jgi:lipopolysaccharide/colanic/teichoic acid biosynthesis glycosyltransferase
MEAASGDPIGSWNATAPSLLLKRAFDIGVSVLAIAVLVPLLLLIVVVIRLTSRGPAMFRQTRIGRDGMPFEMLKFRTMVRDAHDEWPQLAARNGSATTFKLRDDPRTTRVGRLLRRSSLDELPQLVNVLRGEMSLVGPRPLVPEEDALLGANSRLRLSIAPGMTGPWQVLGPIRPTLDEMVVLDQSYASSWSLAVDLGILLRTVRYVLLMRGM